jgi:Ca2+/Na+ antiporter
VFQVLANVLLTITAIYGRVTVPLALGYLLFYALYVLVVLYLDRVKQTCKQPDSDWQKGPGVMSAFWLTPSDIVDFDRHAESSAVNCLTHDFLLLEDEEDQHREQMGAAEAVGPPTFAHRMIGEYFHNLESDLIDGSSLLRDVPQGGEGGARSPQRRVNFAPFSTATTSQEAYEATGAEEDEGAAHFSAVKPPITTLWDNLYWQQWRTRRRLLRQWRASEWADKTRGRQVLSLVELPLIILRNWTIPAVEEESWSRATATLYPLCAPVFLMFVTGTLGARVGHVPVWSLVLVVGSIGSFLIHLGTHENRPPTSFGLFMGFIVIAFIMCSAWIYTIATELVAVIEAMGTLCGIPSSLLGLTLLAWGNSVGDLITNIAVAKAGLSNMAIAGCFAGPTFNLLVGMGLSFLWKALKVGPFELQLDESAVLSLVYLYVGLGLNLVVAYLGEFKLGRTHALALFGLYGACTLIQVCLLFSRAVTR